MLAGVNPALPKDKARYTLYFNICKTPYSVLPNSVKTLTAEPSCANVVNSLAFLVNPNVFNGN